MIARTGTMDIYTNRLHLRRFTADDAAAVFNGWASDPQVTRFMRRDTQTDIAEAEEQVAEWLSDYERSDYYHWCITLKASGEVVGSIGVFPSSEGDGRWEPGYCIARAHWGQGYATEALAAAIAYLHETVGICSFACCHAKANPASGAVMRRVGFTLHGESSYEKHDGTVYESWEYFLDLPTCK